MYPKVTFALLFPNVAKLSSLYKLNQSHHLDCEQALWGPQAAGQEKEGVGLQKCLWNLNILT